MTESQRKKRRSVGRSSKSMINLPTIQILIYVKETLAQYYAKVKGKNYDLVEILDIGLDFRTRCPICGGEDCARFIEYYTRGVIDENGTYYKAFPIARYVCEAKGKTFSLLPHQLIPYIKYSITFIIKMLKARHADGLSISKLQDHVANWGENEILLISADQLSDFRDLVNDAISKILATGYYPRLREKVSLMGNVGGRVIALIEFSKDFECAKVTPQIRGPCGLNYDFYLNEGGYFYNAPFLFGTPSQYRKKQ
jgi:hypothetical protein